MDKGMQLIRNDRYLKKAKEKESKEVEQIKKRWRNKTNPKQDKRNKYEQTKGMKIDRKQISKYRTTTGDWNRDR